jgi:hypothetical protein
MTGPETGHPLHTCCMKEDRCQTAGNQGGLFRVNHQLFVIAGTRNRTGFSA